MRKFQVFSALILAAFTLTSCLKTAAPKDQATGCPTHLRAVFDIGSGSTKMTLAEVRVCGQTVETVRILDDESSFEAALEAGKSQYGTIGAEEQEKVTEGLRRLIAGAVKTVREKAPEYKSIQIAAAATHAVRSARNRKEFGAKVRAVTGGLTILTQAQEARFGYRGAIRKLLTENSPVCAQKNVWVWDTGGGSIQITGPEETDIYLAQQASEAFKKELLWKMKRKKNPPGCKVAKLTPNPLGENGSRIAAGIAEDWAAATLRSAPKLNAANVCVVGIGGVHGKSVEAAIAKNFSKIENCVCPKGGCEHKPQTYTAEEVRCLQRHLSSKNDCDPEIEGPYSTTAVSNLSLIQGYLERMGNPLVHTMNINMGHPLVETVGILDFHPITFENSTK